MFFNINIYWEQKFFRHLSVFSEPIKEVSKTKINWQKKIYEFFKERKMFWGYFQRSNLFPQGTVERFKVITFSRFCLRIVFCLFNKPGCNYWITNTLWTLTQTLELICSDSSLSFSYSDVFWIFFFQCSFFQKFFILRTTLFWIFFHEKFRFPKSLFNIFFSLFLFFLFLIFKKSSNKFSFKITPLNKMYFSFSFVTHKVRMKKKHHINFEKYRQQGNQFPKKFFQVSWFRVYNSEP